MNYQVIERLSENSESRAVNLLQNGQIELAWDRITVIMRTVDLLVLHRELHTWMESGKQGWTETYRLSLNDCCLFLHDDDLFHFCALVGEAVERIPRRVVRWADISVHLAEHSEHDAHTDRFSLN
jgi:hypothetical protein